MQKKWVSSNKPSQRVLGRDHILLENQNPDNFEEDVGPSNKPSQRVFSGAITFCLKTRIRTILKKMWVLQISRINAFSEAITFLLENQNLKNLEVTQRISLNAILVIWNHFSAIRDSVFFCFGILRSLFQDCLSLWDLKPTKRSKTQIFIKLLSLICSLFFFCESLHQNLVCYWRNCRNVQCDVSWLQHYPNSC